MSEKRSAMAIYCGLAPPPSLHAVLELEGIAISQAGCCHELGRLLAETNSPDLLFTDTILPDGTWIDVLKLAANARKAVNVIVVGRWPDVQLYMDAIERGAFDFIVPPFERANVHHILRCATDDVASRREGRARSATSRQPPPVPPVATPGI